MTCGYCGAVVPDGMAYCPVCGAKVDTGLPPEDALADADREVRPILAEAYLALKRRDFQQAEAKCIEALRHFPNNASAHAMLAEVYEAQGRLDEAIEWLRMALDLDPENERIKRRLAGLQARREERERAEGQLVGPPRPPRPVSPPAARRRLWKAGGIVGALVAILVAITYFVGGLARKAPSVERPPGRTVSPPEVAGGMAGPSPTQPPPPLTLPRRKVPSLPAQRPARPSPAQPPREKGPERKEARPPAGQRPPMPAQPSKEVSPGEEALQQMLPELPPYTPGMDVRQYLLGYLRQVSALQKGQVRWAADWVEVDRNRNFVTVFAHIEGAKDVEGLARVARGCARTAAAAVVRAYPPAYWLSVRVRAGQPQGPLVLVADFDRMGMMQALRGASVPLESLAASVWWNPQYFRPAEGRQGGTGPR